MDLMVSLPVKSSCLFVGPCSLLCLDKANWDTICGISMSALSGLMLGFNIPRFQTNVNSPIIQDYPYPMHWTLFSNSALEFMAYITRCSN